MKSGSFENTSIYNELLGVDQKLTLTLLRMNLTVSLTFLQGKSNIFGKFLSQNSIHVIRIDSWNENFRTMKSSKNEY